MYFDALEKRSFAELYDVHADDYFRIFIQDTCSDTRLRNVLLRNGTLTLRDLLMSSPQKVFGYNGFGRLTAVALREYLEKMIAASSKNNNEAQASTNTTLPNEVLVNNTEPSSKQVTTSENKLIPSLESLVADVASSGSASEQEHQVDRVIQINKHLIQDDSPKKVQQPHTNLRERSNASSHKGKTMEALLSYIGWLAPDSVETVKKVFLLFAMIDSADEKGVSSHEQIKDVFLAKSNISLSDPAKEAMDTSTVSSVWDKRNVLSSSARSVMNSLKMSIISCVHVFKKS